MMESLFTTQPHIMEVRKAKPHRIVQLQSLTGWNGSWHPAWDTSLGKHGCNHSASAQIHSVE
eukprot:12887574-Prorocentrum_lima.AAC.1